VEICMPLLHTRAVLLIKDQSVEDRQNLFAIGVDALQVLPEGGLEIVRPHPFVEQRPGHVDILPQSIHGMAAQEKPVKEGGLPLWRQGIVFVSYRHKYGLENASIAVPPGFGQVPP